MRSGLITNADKVFFSERGDTKGDLVEHYLRVAEPLLRTMGGRPTLLQRFPDGAGGPSFFQKRVPKSVPDWLTTTIVSTPNGTTSQALVAADLAHVLWAVNLGCLGFHVVALPGRDPEHADELRIDLDPQPGMDFGDIRQAARRGAGAARRGSASSATPRRPATGGCTSTSACCRAGTPTRCARPRWRSPASSSGAGPT